MKRNLTWEDGFFVIGGIILTVIIIITIYGMLVDNCPSIDARPLPYASCIHMGYKIEINEDNRPVCVFDDNTNCTTDDFYKRLCGVDKVKEVKDRVKCEDVYIELGERCEEGLVLSEPKYLLEQPHCK